MAAELHVAPKADLDISEAFAWYEDRQSGLGDKFLTELEQCFQQVRQHPTANLKLKVQKGFRRALLRRFPYAVFYKHQNDIVEVYCVCHTGRNPEMWQKRLKGV